MSLLPFLFLFLLLCTKIPIEVQQEVQQSFVTSFKWSLQMPSTSAVAWRVGVSITISLKEYHPACVVDPSPLLRLFFVCFLHLATLHISLGTEPYLGTFLLYLEQVSLQSLHMRTLASSHLEVTVHPSYYSPFLYLVFLFSFRLVLTFPPSISHYSLIVKVTIGTNISLNGGMKSKT